MDQSYGECTKVENSSVVSVSCEGWDDDEDVEMVLPNNEKK